MCVFCRDKVAGGPVDLRQSCRRRVDHDTGAFAQTSLVRTLREIVGRLERDVQEAAARLAEPGAVQEEHQQGIRTAVGIRRQRRWRRRRRGDIAPGQKEGPADFEQQANGRRR